MESSYKISLHIIKVFIMKLRLSDNNYSNYSRMEQGFLHYFEDHPTSEVRHVILKLIEIKKLNNRTNEKLFISRHQPTRLPLPIQT